MRRFVVSRVRLDSWALVSSMCVLFVVLLTLAMGFYAGGNMTDHHAPGYSVTRNFLSDLGTTRSWSGKPNGVSAGLFALAMSCAAGGVGLYFVTFARRACPGPLSRVPGWFAVLFGLPAAILLFGVACCPANLWPVAHGYCASRAMGLMAPAMLFQGLALLCSGGAFRRAAMTLIALAILLGVFVCLPRLGMDVRTRHGLMGVAITQKLTVLAALGGIWVMSCVASRRERHQPEGKQEIQSQKGTCLCPTS